MDACTGVLSEEYRQQGCDNTFRSLTACSLANFVQMGVDEPSHAVVIDNSTLDTRLWPPVEVALCSGDRRIPSHLIDDQSITPILGELRRRETY